MKSIKIKKEEFDTNRNEIAKAEALWDINFPKDYVEFLLQYNGGVAYPDWPNLGPENKTEIWGVERFFSIGDVIIQKQYPMSYTLHDIEEEDFEEHQLNRDNILVFAQGVRGVYFFNLAEKEHGHIYIANFSGGDGISRTSAKTFTQFIDSFEMPDWSDEEFDPEFEFSNEFHSGVKVMQNHLFYTPENPALGLQRFKEVFDYHAEVTSSKDGFAGIAYKYVDEIPKLKYLLQKGCSTDNLLRGAKRAKTVQYLVNELNLDVNKMDGGRYPLQNYLSAHKSFVQHRYEHMHKMLEMGIPFDWSIQAKMPNGEDDIPMIEKLRILHELYEEIRAEEEAFRKKYRRPSGRPPLIKSKPIKQKLGIVDEQSWLDKLLNRITGGED